MRKWVFVTARGEYSRAYGMIEYTFEEALQLLINMFNFLDDLGTDTSDITYNIVEV